MMLETTIPPRPATFTPTGAPPGVEVRLDVFGAWPASRPIIRPRVAIVHTNGATVEASVQSSINYGNAAPSNTKPHYHVGDRPSKVLATNRRAIANATGDDLQAATGEVDCALWSIAIETADMGSRAATAAGIAWPGDCGPFLTRPSVQPDDDEIVARILAYESIVWDFPLEQPDAWNGTGVAAHTIPFPFPHYTIQRGKTCPGRTKANQLFGQILARAQQIRDAWLDVTPPTEEADMTAVKHTRIVDTRFGSGGRLKARETRIVNIPATVPRPAAARAVIAKFEVVNPAGGGYIAADATTPDPDTNVLPFPAVSGLAVVPVEPLTGQLATARFAVYASEATDLIIDVQGWSV